MNYDKKPVLKCRCTAAGGLFYKKIEEEEEEVKGKKIRQEKCRTFTAVNKWSSSN